MPGSCEFANNFRNLKLIQLSKFRILVDWAHSFCHQALKCLVLLPKGSHLGFVMDP